MNSLGELLSPLVQIQLLTQLLFAFANVLFPPDSLLQQAVLTEPRASASQI